MSLHMKVCKDLVTAWSTNPDSGYRAGDAIHLYTMMRGQRVSGSNRDNALWPCAAFHLTALCKATRRKPGLKKRRVGTARALQCTLVAEASRVLGPSGGIRTRFVACKSRSTSAAELKAHFKSSDIYCL